MSCLVVWRIARPSQRKMAVPMGASDGPYKGLEPVTVVQIASYLSTDIRWVPGQAWSQ